MARKLKLPRSILSEKEPHTAAEPGRSQLPKKRNVERSHTTPKDEQAAIRAFEREKRSRAKEREKELARRKLIEKKREAAIAKAKSVLREAERNHDTVITMLEARQHAIRTKIESEEGKWYAKRTRLELAVKKAGEI